MSVENLIEGAIEVPTAEPSTSTTSIITQPLPLLTRLNYALRTWATKIFVAAALGAIRFLQRSKFKAIAPTYTKRYPVRPMLESRVFIPKDFVAGSKLPLYLDIHGGGFAICDPQNDDQFCRHIADTYGYCVVSVDYRKAPVSPFPVPVHDCAELVRAVLADKDLPVDHDKVVLGGFSAGGNLSLAVAQFEDIRPRLRGVVPIYPVTDFSGNYRGDYIRAKDGRDDILRHSSKLFNWAYVPSGINRADPLLSVIYATPETLPAKIFFVGCEYDCLCNEANVMAKKLAGIEHQPDLGPKWNQNGIQWEFVPGQQHGFTHMERRGNEEKERQQQCNELYQHIDAWIRKEAFQQ